MATARGLPSLCDGAEGVEWAQTQAWRGLMRLCAARQWRGHFTKDTSMEASRQASPFAGIEWNLKGGQDQAKSQGIKSGAHADMGSIALAARVQNLELDDDYGREADALRAAAIRETAGALPNNAEYSLNERVLEAHREHSKAIALMVSVSLKAIPEARVEGSLSKFDSRDREWTASGLSVTLADDPSRTWDIRLSGEASYRGGGYSGSHLAHEGAIYAISAEQRGGIELDKGRQWDEGSSPTTIGLEAREYVLKLNKIAREYEE